MKARSCALRANSAQFSILPIRAVRPEVGPCLALRACMSTINQQPFQKFSNTPIPRTPRISQAVDTIEKLTLLSDDSKYDLSCSCGTDEATRRKKQKDGTWLYPVQLAAGGTGVLFKTLLSNACSSDCRYCPLRHDGASRRCSLSPDEAAAAFMEFNRRQWLLGAFFSSGIVGSPDRTMEMLTDTAAILRKRHKYRGYIHLKIIPGASDAAVRRAMQLSSAVSLNIEVPGEQYFNELSKYKRFAEDIVRPIKLMAEMTKRDAEFSRVKCSTQFIVGAASEPDSAIVRYMGGIYERLRFQRIYFSAYQPQNPGESDGENFQLSAAAGESPAEKRAMREHRLYQTDYLLRSYKFSAGEIAFGANGNLSLAEDPKKCWADAHPEFYPIRVNTAAREELLRVPGIGPVQASRIIAARKTGKLRDWSDIGMRGKNAAKPLGYATFG